MAKRTDMTRTLLASYQGPDEHRDRLEKILNEADFFPSDYGALAYSLAEMQAAGGRATTAAQNVIGSLVSEAFDSAYQSYAGSLGEDEQPLAPTAYFAKNREAYYEVLGRPLNSGWAREQKVPYSSQTVGELLPSAFSATTVQGGMDWLARSELPQVIQSLVHLDRDAKGQINWRSVGQNFADELQTGMEAVYASLPNYKPPTQASKNNFAFFAGSQAEHAIRRFRADEKLFSGGKINMGWLESDSEGDAPEYGSGVYSDANSEIETLLGTAGTASEAPEYLGGIAGGNAFTEKPYMTDNPEHLAKIPELTRNALLGIQAMEGARGFSSLTRDIFGNYSQMNAQTRQKEVDRQWGAGNFGEAKVSAYEYGLDPTHVQVFGIDPNSPAGQVGMKEGAFLTSFNDVLKSPRLRDVMDAVENGNAFGLAYLQPDDQGIYREYVSVFQMGAPNQNSADQGPEDNWIKQFARTLDPEMGRTLLQTKATWRKNGDDYKYVELPPTVSHTEGRSALPTDLWTTGPEYVSGMVKGKGGWEVAPLSTQQSEKYNTRVQVDPQSINAFADLYQQSHEAWNSPEAKTLLKSAEIAEGKARQTVAGRYTRAVQAGNGSKFPAMETAIEREVQIEMHKAGIDQKKVAFLRGGLTMENELRSLKDSVASTAAEIEPASSAIEEADNLFNTMPRKPQSGRGTPPARAERVVNRDRQQVMRLDSQRVGPDFDNFSLTRLAADGSYAGEAFRPYDARGSQAVDALGLFSDRPISGEMTGAVASAMSAINEFGHFQAEQPPDAEKEFDETLLGGDPASWAELDPGGVLVGPKEVLDQTNVRRKISPPEMTFPMGRGEDQEAFSIEAINRKNPDSGIYARQEADRNYENTNDPELEYSNQSYAGIEAARAYERALVVEDPRHPGATNAAMIGDFGARYGLYENVGKKGKFTPLFDRMNAAHPENYQSFKALEGVTLPQDRKAVVKAGMARLNQITAALRQAGRPDVQAHMRLGETPAFVEEALKSKSGYPREALQEASEAYGLGLSFQRGKEADLGKEIETLRSEQPEMYGKLKTSVLADAADQLKAGEAWMSKLGLKRGAADPAHSAPAPARAAVEEPVFDDEVPMWEGAGDPNQEEELWENRSGHLFDTGKTPADRQAKAAYAWGQATGDMTAAREKVLYPEAQGGTPQPNRSLPHVSEEVGQQMRSLFTDTEHEEAGFLVGRKNDQGGVDIFGVVRPQQRGPRNKNRTYMTAEMVEESNQAAGKMGGFLAGFFHTHPGDASLEPQYLRPSNTDVLGPSLAGAGSMSSGNWGKDSIHAIYNPVSGNYRLWNQGEGAAIDVTNQVREPSAKPSRVGLRKDRQRFQGIEARNSFDDVTPPDPMGEPPPLNEDDFNRLMGSLDEEELSSAGNTPPPARSNGRANSVRYDGSMGKVGSGGHGMNAGRNGGGSSSGGGKRGGPPPTNPADPWGASFDEPGDPGDFDATPPDDAYELGPEDWEAGGQSATRSSRRVGYNEPEEVERRERAKRVVVDHPGAYRRLKPKQGWMMESEGSDGSLRVLEARMNGGGPSARPVWMEQDESGAWHTPDSIPTHGTISNQGETIAEVSEAESKQWDAEAPQRARERAAGAASRGLSPYERAIEAGRGVEVGHIQKLNRREIAGAPRRIGKTGDTWEISYTDDDGERQTSVSSTQLAAAHGIAQKALTSALNSDLPSNPVEKVAAVKQRIIDNAAEDAEKTIDAEIKAGVSPDLARANGDQFKKIVKHYAEAVANAASTSLGDALGVTPSDARKINDSDVRLKNLDEVNALMARSPQAAAALNGRSPEQVWRSGEYFPVTDEDGKTFDIGTQGKYDRYGRGGGGGGNLFRQGGIGNAMYGAYMLSREWKMAMGQPISEADAYGKYVSAMGQIALPEGTVAAQTDVGYTARQEIGKQYMGRGAYQTLGGFMDVPYLMSGYGDGPARMATTAGLGAGIAGATFIGAASMVGMGMLPAAAAGPIGWAGLAVGGAIAATGAGMEIYNGLYAKPGEEVTLSKAVGGLEKGGILGRLALQDMSQRHGVSLFGAAQEGFDLLTGRKLDAAGMTEPEKDIMNTKGTPKEVQDLLDAATGIQRLTGEDQSATVQAAAMQKRVLGHLDYDMLRTSAQIAVERGEATSTHESEGASYAQQLGYLPGTADFEDAYRQYTSEKNLGASERLKLKGSRVAALGSQIQSSMGWTDDYQGLGSRLITGHNVQTQQQTGAINGMGAGLQQYNAPLSATQWDQVASISQRNNPYISGVVGGAMTQYAAAGGSTANAISFGEGLSSAGMSNQSASIFSQMAQGDLGAYSHQAWQTGDLSNAFNDRAGNSIIQTNGAVAMQVYNKWAPQFGFSQMTTSQFLGGTTNQTIIKAFEENGMYGIQKYAAEASYNASMASVGIALKGIALTENYNWGQNAGGSWDNPTSGSAWGIEDRQIALQNQSQRASFAEQWTRMNTQNDFSIAREANQAQRMTANNNYQNYQWSYSYNQAQQSQAWTREDWQYQETTRQLNFTWQMEDINTELKYATGRERKQLLIQRDRAALTQNRTEEQVDKEQDRQSQVWAQQEEQFQKQRQYTLELQRLDQESFAQNKQQRETFFKLDVESYNRHLKEYEETKKLEEEARELQRKYQYDQLQLQKESAAAQAAAAAAQFEANKAQIEGQKNWQEHVIGPFQEMNKYDLAFGLMTAATEMFKTANGVPTSTINKMIELLKVAGSTNATPQYNRPGQIEDIRQ